MSLETLNSTPKCWCCGCETNLLVRLLKMQQDLDWRSTGWPTDPLPEQLYSVNSLHRGNISPQLSTEENSAAPSSTDRKQDNWLLYAPVALQWCCLAPPEIKQQKPWKRGRLSVLTKSNQRMKGLELKQCTTVLLTIFQTDAFDLFKNASTVVSLATANCLQMFKKPYLHQVDESLTLPYKLEFRCL